jgi:hypothetical protein
MPRSNFHKEIDIMQQQIKNIVAGGISLSGSITPSGNKNEALPVLAAIVAGTCEPVTMTTCAGYSRHCVSCVSCCAVSRKN